MFNWKESPAIWFSVQATSSIALTLLNKGVAMALPFPFLVLAIQNIVSIVLFVAFNKVGVLPMNPLSFKQILYFLPTTFGYVVVLWTSLEGLRLVSVSFVIIARNFVPLLTAAIETTFFGLKLHTDGYLSLFLVFLGSIVYGSSDVTLSWQGFLWLSGNLAAVVLIPIVEKRLMSNLKNEQTPTGTTFLRNLLSVPILLLFALSRNSVSQMADALLSIKPPMLLSLGATCLFGFSIGLAYFFLLNLVSNTSLAIANTFYKLLTLVGSLIIWSVPFGTDGLMGIIMSFVGITWYTVLQQQKSASASSQPELPLTHHNGFAEKIKPHSIFRAVVLILSISASFWVFLSKYFSEY